ITSVLLQDVRPTKSHREIACEIEPTTMSQRLSMRSDRRPVASDVSPQTQAAGSMISPACAASKPSACSKNNAMMKFMAKLATAPRTNCPLAKTCKFTMGASEVHSAATKASRPAPAMARRVGLVQDGHAQGRQVACAHALQDPKDEHAFEAPTQAAQHVGT